jgi:urease accessory protein
MFTCWGNERMIGELGMRTAVRAIAASIVTTLMWGAPAFAHTGEGAHVHGTEALLAGLAHPFTGWDHLIAMVCVGLLAGRLGGASMWKLPALFVGSAALGALAALAGVAVPLVEVVIIASVVVLAITVFIGTGWDARVLAGMIGLFGFAHGCAHGLEAPGGALVFVPAFLLSTAVLHGLGVFAGRTLWRLPSTDRA